MHIFTNKDKPIVEMLTLYGSNGNIGRMLKKSGLINDFNNIANSIGITNWQQIKYHIVNKINDIPLCEICGINKASFGKSRHGNIRAWGYVTCSKACTGIKAGETNTGFNNNTPKSLEKRRNTCLEKYGVDSTMKLESFKSINKAALMTDFGVDNYGKSKECAENNRKRSLIKFANNYMIHGYELIDYPNNGKLKLKHIECGNIFEIEKSRWKYCREYDFIACTKCNDWIGYRSQAERHLTIFIKELYKGIVYNNIRKIIYPYELDIYIPNLQLAFEYNGKYWHKLKPEGYHDMKTKLCERKGIKLVHIDENDYLLNKEAILKMVSDLILLS